MTATADRTSQCLLLDWGNTLMRDFPSCAGPMANWPRVEAIPGAVEALASLWPEWTLALATNAEDSQEAQIRSALQRVDLDRWLDRIYCFRTVGHRKPSADFFSYVLKDLNIPSQRVIMVGDDFQKDILGANRAGLRAIWFHENHAHQPSVAMFRTMDNFDRLPELVRELSCQ